MARWLKPVSKERRSSLSLSSGQTRTWKATYALAPQITLAKHDHLSPPA